MSSEMSSKVTSGVSEIEISTTGVSLVLPGPALPSDRTDRVTE